MTYNIKNFEVKFIEDIFFRCVGTNSVPYNTKLDSADTLLILGIDRCD